MAVNKNRNDGHVRELGAIGMILTVLACAGGPPAGGTRLDPSPSGITTQSPSPSDGAVAPSTSPAISFERIDFEAADGTKLVGRLYGSGNVGVVLSHMGNEANSQDDWQALAGSLVDAGYQVLTYNRRGVCSSGNNCSGGVDSYAAHWKDVVGAATFMHHHASMVVLGGASIGAMATLEAVVAGGAEAQGVIWIAGLLDASGYRFTEDEVEHLDAPILVMSADRDPYSAADDAQTLFDWTPEPHRLTIVSSTLHGSDMLGPGAPLEVRETTTKAVLEFIEGVGR